MMQQSITWNSAVKFVLLPGTTGIFSILHLPRVLNIFLSLSILAQIVRCILNEDGIHARGR